MVSLHDAPLSDTAQLRVFYRLAGLGCVVRLFVFYGYQGAEEDPGKLAHADWLLLAVLAEAQVVRVGQPVVIDCK